MWSFASGLCCYPVALSRPSAACAEEAHASDVGSAVEAPCCSRRRSLRLLLAHLLLSSSAVEAQCCLRRRSPCIHRRQRCRGPSLLALKKPPAAAGAEEIPYPMPSSKKTAGTVPFVLVLPCHHITGPASLAEQISPEYVCSLLFLVPLLQPDTSFHLLFTRPKDCVLSLNTDNSTWARITRPVDVDDGLPSATWTIRRYCKLTPTGPTLHTRTGIQLA